MDPETAKSWLEILRDLGLGFTAAMVLIVRALRKGTLRWDWDVERCEKTSKEWEDRSETNTELVDKSTAALERNTAVLEQLLTRVKRLEARRP
jgi:hypothetical protein